MVSKLKEDSAAEFKQQGGVLASLRYLQLLSNFVIFQGVGRRFITCRIMSSLLAQRMQLQVCPKIAIPTLWRSYDTCMAYARMLSDIVMLQAMV